MQENRVEVGMMNRSRIGGQYNLMMMMLLPPVISEPFGES